MNPLKRLFRSLTGTRSFDGAAGGRRWEGAKSIASMEAATRVAAMPLRRRARYYVANNPWAANAASSFAANLVGAGIKPQAQHPNPDVRRAINDLWERQSDFTDADGLTDFQGQQALAARTLFIDGELFARLEVGGSGPVPLRLRLIDPDQVDASLTRVLDDGRRVIAGVEFDRDGNRLTYHVFPTRPGDPALTALNPVVVPAQDMVHLFQPLAPGQVRGVSWLHPVLLRLHELDQTEDAQLVRQKVAALFAGFILDGEGGAAGFEVDGTPAGPSVLDGGLEPGTLKVLPPGKDIRFSDPAQVGDVPDFIKMQLRGIAAGMGIPYEMLTGDLSSVNYSSIRAGLVEFRRRVEQVQHSTLVFQFLRPVWRRFITLAVMSGALPVNDFAANAEAYMAVKWITPGFDWVDPKKDVEADALAVVNGFKSRREVVAARGYDIEALDEEIAGDAARATGLGLTLGQMPTAPAPTNEDTINA
jgi:lambda family phage portal protein